MTGVVTAPPVWEVVRLPGVVVMGLADLGCACKDTVELVVEERGGGGREKRTSVSLNISYRKFTRLILTNMH